MQPVYRQGDIIIVSPNANIRRGDRVVVRTKRGEVMAKVLERQTAKTLELSSFKDQDLLSVARDDVEWIARIIWASQ
jgi:phage repressor protein C with HTH and peptisase S24 domain